MPDDPKLKVPALKQVSEAVRERETFRYDATLLSHIDRRPDPRGVPNSELFTANDTILTALAQLAVHETGTTRSMISLFDTHYQYVVAEATIGLPLRPRLSAEERDGLQLLLCGTGTPREVGVCEYVLRGEGSSDAEDADRDDVNQLPLVLAPDLCTDPRFCGKQVCVPESPARFYAAVPIRSPRGINIGVFCVMDGTPGKSWDHRKTQQMRNISQNIMGYLETRSSMENLNRSVRMTRGLGSFMEGKTTVSGWRFGPSEVAFEDRHSHEGWLNEHQQTLQRNAEDGSQQLALSHLMDHSPYQSASSSFRKTDESDGSRVLTNPTNPFKTGADTVRDIFSRVANIIRESIEVEGCLFLDAQVRSFGGLKSPNRADTTDYFPNSSSQGSSDDSSPGDGPLTFCEALGFSTSAISSIDGAEPLNLHTTLPEKFLRKLLRHYPKGKIFNFDHNGELQSSESSEDDPVTQTPGRENPSSHGPNASQRRSTGRARYREGETIIKAFPGARSVAFVPVWDSKRERWFAGGFVYTYTPTRVFTVQGELSYLRAFGMIAMTETFALETSQANKAKSDVLGSISHELRSPLHGVVLAAELLRDTELSVFQGNIVHTIETCGRTLTDTVDHLLDFAKINNFIRTTRSRGHPGELNRGYRFGRRGSVEAGIKSLYSDVELDALAEEVMESVFAGYNFQHASLGRSRGQSLKVGHLSASANRQTDLMYAMEDLAPMITGRTEFNLGNVSLQLDLDPNPSWSFHTQAGAVRRILMNLFGNALKYTHKGWIRLRMRQGPRPGKRSPNERLVSIEVIDTGIGMSEDFLQHHVFTPFEKENQLSAGTGLGLPLVKRIVTQLEGTISMHSQLGHGTTVLVTLPMVQSSQIPPSLDRTPSLYPEDNDFRPRISELKGLRIRLVGLDGDHSWTALGKNYGTPFSVCRDWLHLEVISDAADPNTTKAPDLVLTAEEAIDGLGELSPRSPPTVIICSNAILAHQQALKAKSGDESAITEYISQPLAPRKLAKILLIAFKRWIDFQARKASPNLLATAYPTDPLNSPQSGHSPMPSFAPTPAEPFTMPPQPSGFNLPDGVHTPSPQPAQSFHFLLVDDNHINIKVLSTYVGKLGRECDIASNGQEALDAYVANPHKYNCIFMDISMPVMDGFESTRQIRAHERKHHLAPTAVFALSGLASNEAQQEAFRSGIDLFLSKPVTLKELSTILKMKELL